MPLPKSSNPDQTLVGIVLLKGIVNKKIVCLNLKFWDMMRSGIAHFGRRGQFRWFLDPSDQNELYHTPSYSKIWDLSRDKIVNYPFKSNLFWYCLCTSVQNLSLELMIFSPHICIGSNSEHLSFSNVFCRPFLHFLHRNQHFTFFSPGCRWLLIFPSSSTLTTFTWFHQYTSFSFDENASF